MIIDGEKIRIEFEMGEVMVVYTHKGRETSADHREMTVCRLTRGEDQVGYAHVVRHHKDPHNAKLARRAAFKKAVQNWPEEKRNVALQQFFAKMTPRRITNSAGSVSPATA